MSAAHSRRMMLVVAGMIFLVIPGVCAWGVYRAFNPPIRPTIESQIAQLYDAHKFADVVTECERAETDNQYDSSLPQILYLHWLAQEQLGRFDEVDRLEHTFVDRFPGNTLGADMYFVDATRMLEKCQYDAADKRLVKMIAQYPSALVVEEAREMHQRLKAMGIKSAQ